jgi:hypothetical protein
MKMSSIRFFAFFVFSLFFFVFANNSNAQGCGGSLTLSASPGPSFDQVTLTWTGIGTNINGFYTLRGRKQGDASWAGSPIQTFVQSGQTVNFQTSNYAISTPMQTYKTYEFQLVTSVCTENQESNIASATTFDIGEPSISASTGPGMEEITLDIAEVVGGNLGYKVYGKREEDIDFFEHSELTYSIPGQHTTGFWQLAGPMATYKTYQFKVKVQRGDRIKCSPYAIFEKKLK